MEVSDVLPTSTDEIPICPQHDDTSLFDRMTSSISVRLDMHCWQRLHPTSWFMGEEQSRSAIGSLSLMHTS